MSRDCTARFNAGGDASVRPTCSIIPARPQIRSIRHQLSALEGKLALSIGHNRLVTTPRRRPCVSPSAILGGLGKLLSGDASEKTRKTYQGLVDQINALEPGLRALSDEQLRAKTDDFRARFKAGETLDDLLVDAFAVGPLASVLVDCLHTVMLLTANSQHSMWWAAHLGAFLF